MNFEAFSLQCCLVRMIDKNCPDTMIRSRCASCAPYCDSDDVTNQPHCNAKSKNVQAICAFFIRQYCSCPEGWKWLNGKCVQKCPQEICADDGLVYHKCYHTDWQLCPVYSTKVPEARINRGRCYPGCFCPEGLFNIKGRCVDEEYCEVEEGKCGPGMEYSKHANPCRRDCRAVKDMENCRTLALEGCFCRIGTYYIRKTKTCGSRKQCLLND